MLSDFFYLRDHAISENFCAKGSRASQFMAEICACE